MRSVSAFARPANDGSNGPAAAAGCAQGRSRSRRTARRSGSTGGFCVRATRVPPSPFATAERTWIRGQRAETHQAALRARLNLRKILRLLCIRAPTGGNGLIYFFSLPSPRVCDFAPLVAPITRVDLPGGRPTALPPPLGLSAPLVLIVPLAMPSVVFSAVGPTPVCFIRAAPPRSGFVPGRPDHPRTCSGATVFGNDYQAQAVLSHVSDPAAPRPRQENPFREIRRRPLPRLRGRRGETGPIVVSVRGRSSEVGAAVAGDPPGCGRPPAGRRGGRDSRAAPGTSSPPSIMGSTYAEGRMRTRGWGRQIAGRSSMTGADLTVALAGFVSVALVRPHRSTRSPRRATSSGAPAPNVYAPGFCLDGDRRKPSRL